MLLTSKIPLVMLAAAGFVGPFAVQTSLPPKADSGPGVKQPALIELQPGIARYRVAGDFTRAGKPAEAPLVTARIEHPIGIMRAQVTAVEYRRCVADSACKPLAGAQADDRPAVQVSWHDANDYAIWLSRKTGVTYRLPTDEEWSYAAGTRSRDDGIAVDANDPSRRWLERYEREAKLKEASEGPSEPQPVGRFGANENGLVDLSGNVWEWTSTCFTRVALDEAARAPTVNCGVRVVEGQHRSYVTDFIRDARAGGCAAGIPPTNLGFRLVAERGNTLPALVASAFRKLRSVML